MSCNILLVSHSDFPANSAVHVHHYANELVKLGCDCIVAVPYRLESVKEMSDCLYAVTDFQQTKQLASRFKNGLPPQIIHCWTPREHVRKFCCQLSIQYNSILIVHLEDNEEAITSRFLGVPIKNFDLNVEKRLPHNLSHPARYKKFMETADGATIIMETLKGFLAPDMPHLTLFPGVDRQEFYPRPPDSALLQELGISEQSTVICYTGNVHLANQEDIRELYLAIGNRNRAGKETVLVRTGIDNNLAFLGEDDLWVKQYVKEMGWVKRERIPSILSIANLLVQPGSSDEFNDYRFPSKIPEFLAMGKPVILPDTNIANYLTHLVNSFIISDVNQNSLVEAIDFLMDNSDICSQIVRGGLQYAENYLDWGKNAEKLLAFYGSFEFSSCEDSQEQKINKRLKLFVDDYQQEVKSKFDILNQDINDKNQQIQLQASKINELITHQHLLESELSGMESSKFWRLRELWVSLKHTFFDKLRR